METSTNNEAVDVAIADVRGAAITELLSAKVTTAAALPAAILEKLKSESHNGAIELMVQVLTERRPTPGDDAETLPSPEIDAVRWAEIGKRNTEMIRGFLKRSVEKSTDATAFAKDVVSFLELLGSTDEKTHALAAILYSSYVPFRALPRTAKAVSMQEFRNLIEQNTDTAEKIKYVVGLPSTEVTEEADRVLSLIEEEGDREVRVALLTYYNVATRHKITRQILAKRQR